MWRSTKQELSLYCANHDLRFKVEKIPRVSLHAGAGMLRCEQDHDIGGSQASYSWRLCARCRTIWHQPSTAASVKSNRADACPACVKHKRHSRLVKAFRKQNLRHYLCAWCGVITVFSSAPTNGLRRCTWCSHVPHHIGWHKCDLLDKKKEEILYSALESCPIPGCGQKPENLTFDGRDGPHGQGAPQVPPDDEVSEPPGPPEATSVARARIVDRILPALMLTLMVVDVVLTVFVFAERVPQQVMFPRALSTLACLGLGAYVVVGLRRRPVGEGERKVMEKD